LLVQQSLQVVGGSQVPTVGETSVYEHLVRITNTGGGPLSLSLDGNGMVRAASYPGLLQGQTLSVTFNTDYSPDSMIVNTSSNVGQTSVRGQTVTWNGQLGSGESVELRTTVAQTPTSSLVLNQPVRGQSLQVADPARGTTLTVPPARLPAPQLPPAQRVVQPTPPPVDPITAPRFFPAMGFTVTDDDVWNYFVRRGGQRTFGLPLSRTFTLEGTRVQLFERGLLQVVEAPDGRRSVTAVNLLEAPFLPFERLGDELLPPVDGGLVVGAPDPEAPSFGQASQEFVQAAAPEGFEGKNTRFYSTFLGTVLYRDAFFNGEGDPNLVPLFDLEIWGLPTSQPDYGLDANGLPDPQVVYLRFQRGVMRHDARAGATRGIDLGSYLRSVLRGEPSLAGVATNATPLWAQYDPTAPRGVARPDELPDTDLTQAFEPEEPLGLVLGTSERRS
jgi:hypothetical protein